jgi:hypothetical protein
MERCNRLGFNGLDRDGVDVLVVIRLQERLRIGAIRLAAAHIAVHIVSRQQSNRVPELLQLSRPVMGRPARFQQHSGGWLLGEVRQEPVTRQASLSIDSPSVRRDRDLKHGLCEIDGNGRMLHPDPSLPWPSTRPFSAWHDDAA